MILIINFCLHSAHELSPPPSFITTARKVSLYKYEEALRDSRERSTTYKPLWPSQGDGPPSFQEGQSVMHIAPDGHQALLNSLARKPASKPSDWVYKCSALNQSWHTYHNALIYYLT